MNKRWLLFLLNLIPILACADDSTTLSFAPPASDYSVVFLGNLFGAVDGVLHSSGSQIMGAMFTVFNSAVLALGGIIIMYTLMVSTMNTAQEGQMLGQKWSSIWIPLRSTFGLALLIPKASGYCLMQIFVMWIVVQGVGAADKVWQAALSYLNRGGVIIQAEPNPGISLLDAANGKALALPKGAFTILVGQVCMLGIQKQLEQQRTIDMSDGGRCKENPIPDDAKTLCQNSVPDFLSTVNFVNLQSTSDQGVVTEDKSGNKTVAHPYLDDKGNYVMKMPYFALNGTSPYSSLDGSCGTIKWKPVAGVPTGPTGTNTTVNAGTTKTNEETSTSWSGFGNKTQNSATAVLTGAEVEAAQLSRAIALQQMYVDLSFVAQTMINNDPDFSQSNNSNNSNNGANTQCNSSAQEQFGIPYNATGGTCTSSSSSNQSCSTWGPDPTLTNTCGGGVLFNGTEFAGAVADYNGVIQPTLRLIQTINKTQTGDNARSFIATSNAQGWITAGAYFFDLVKLNGSAASSSTAGGNGYDTQSGLEASVLTSVEVNTPSASADNTLYNTTLDGMLDSVKSNVTVISNLIQGITPNTVTAPSFSTSQQNLTAQTGALSLNVYGFVNNSLMVQQAGQPGAYNNLNFANTVSVTVSPNNQYLKPMTFGCGNVKTFMFSFCLGGLMGDIFYNAIILVVFNVFIAIFGQLIQQLMMAFMTVPLQALAQIFQAGLAMINSPGANPIIALANMGVYYINFAGNLWLTSLGLIIAFSIAGPLLLLALIFVLPLLLSWLGIMVSIGFSTAYYIPILPYMIFTFGAVAWLITVIEAMVAAPIVALGVTHPEGHDAFGKGEAAIMLLMSVFLRPAMMIIGYISAIALSYVSIWVLNAGYEHAISFIQAPQSSSNALQTMIPQVQTNSDYGNSLTGGTTSPGSGTGGYSDWAGIFAFFFSILTYTTMYITLVQKAFTLITYLPDKVLRWIGGSPESIGAESSQWGDEMVKGKQGEAAKASQDSLGQSGKQAGGKGQEQGAKAKKKGDQESSSGTSSAQADTVEATPSSGGALPGGVK